MNVHAVPQASADELLSRLEEAGAELKEQQEALATLAAQDPSALLALLGARENGSAAPAADCPWRPAIETAMRQALLDGDPRCPAQIRELLDNPHAAPSADRIATILAGIPAQRRGEAFREALQEARKRHPRNATLLRLDAETRAAAGDADQAHALLSELARIDATPTTRMQVWRARKTLPSPGTPTVRVALLSSFTLDLLLPHLDFELRELGLAPEIYLAPFNTWPQELIGAESGLKQFKPDISFLAVSLDDLIPQLAGAVSYLDLDALGQTALERVVGAVRQYAATSERPLVVNSFYSAYRDPRGIARSDSPARARPAWLNALNLQLADELGTLPNVYLLDMPELLQHRQGGGLDNPKMRHLAAMRMPEAMLTELARAYARFTAPVKGLTRKCVVLDLDNTLWGGIIGEDGMHGIKLGHTAPGSEFKEFQAYLKALTTRGFLLAINSKNNPDDALAAIREHPEMVLREEDFSAVRINWEPKHTNIAAIAKELNLGIDSMVFVDDNPKERELLRQMLPQVLVPELPPDPALYRKTLEDLPQLQSLVVTDEDKMRVEQYRANRQREVAKGTSGSLDDYLGSLELVADIGPADESTLPRVHQLFQRTNQFNLTTRRYDLGELTALAAAPNARLYTMRVTDRFGDHGLVGVALVRSSGKQWTIDSFLMSCRVIGYGAETCLLATMLEDAAAQGASAVVGEYIQTKKNVPARDFYERHGFARTGEDGEIERWRLDLLDCALGSPNWFKVVRRDT